MSNHHLRVSQACFSEKRADKVKVREVGISGLLAEAIKSRRLENLSRLEDNLNLSCV